MDTDSEQAVALCLKMDGFRRFNLGRIGCNGFWSLWLAGPQTFRKKKKTLASDHHRIAGCDGGGVLKCVHWRNLLLRYWYQDVRVVFVPRAIAGDVLRIIHDRGPHLPHMQPRFYKSMDHRPLPSSAWASPPQQQPYQLLLANSVWNPREGRI